MENSRESGINIEKSKPSIKQIIRAWLAIGIVVLMVFTSLQAVLPAAAAANQERVLTMAMGEPIDSANPWVGITDNAYIFWGLVYDYLMTPNETLINKPNLATSWWYMDGNTSQNLGTDFTALSHHKSPSDWPLGSIWEYNITNQAYWNDGVPLTADDVKWTIEIQLGNNFASYWAYQPYTRWIDHVEKVNDYKVRVFYADKDTKKPFAAAFGHNLFMPIMPQHAFIGKASTYVGQTWDGLPVIGTGYFMGTDNLRQELIAKESVTLVKNPFYNFTEDGVAKGIGNQYKRDIQIDKLILKFFSEETTLSLSVKTGDADCGEIQAGTYMNWRNDASLSSSISIQSVLSPTAYSKEVVINDYANAPGTLNALRLDPAVQYAVALTTNKTWVRESVYKGLCDPGYSLFSKVWPDWYWEPGENIAYFNVTDENGTVLYTYAQPEIHLLDYNVTAAREILKAAGYEWANGSGETVQKAGPLAAKRMKAMFGGTADSYLNKKLEFEMVVESEIFEDKQIGDFLLNEYEKIGVWLKSGSGDHATSIVNTATWNTLIYSYTYNMMQTYWSGDIDPNYFGYIVSSYALTGWNEFGTNVSEYDQIYIHSAQTFDYAARKQWTDKMNEWVYLSGSIMVLGYPKICFATNNETWENWGNWTTQPGMTMDAFWTENPLFWHLTYKGPTETGPTDIMPIVIAVVVVAAIVGVIVAITLLRKKKKTAMLEEEEEETEETGKT